jgi:hypothetical protein
MTHAEFIAAQVAQLRIDQTVCVHLTGGQTIEGDVGDTEDANVLVVTRVVSQHSGQFFSTAIHVATIAAISQLFPC